MSTQPLSLEQFAGKIKAKYPQYQSVPDMDLATKLIEKYPQYKDSVSIPSTGRLNMSKADAERIQKQNAPLHTETAKTLAEKGAPTTGMVAGGIVGGMIAGPPGAGVGAALGGGTGKAFQQKLEGQDTNKPAAMKEQLESAAIGGASEAIPVAAFKGLKAIPSKKAGIMLLDSVMKDAKAVPVELHGTAAPLLRAKELADAGGSMPMSLNKLLTRATKPNAAPMTYAEARDFYSNITRLSADETKRLTPVMQRQVGQVAAALNEDIGNAAATVNKAADYYAGVKEYAKAAALQRHAQAIGKYLLKAGLGAAGIGAAGDLIYRVATK